MWIALPVIGALVLAVAAFLAGLAPVGVGLLVIAAGLAAFQTVQGGPSAQRAKRAERLDVNQNLGPAHDGQAHMTPDQLPEAEGRRAST